MPVKVQVHVNLQGGGGLSYKKWQGGSLYFSRGLNLWIGTAWGAKT